MAKGKKKELNINKEKPITPTINKQITAANLGDVEIPYGASARPTELPKSNFRNPSKNQPPIRSLKDVSYQELHDAVVKMVKDLGIPGSGSNYSLYHVVARERARITPDDPDTKALYPNGLDDLID